jgi:transposase-like protein
MQLNDKSDFSEVKFNSEIKIDENALKSHIGEFVRETVEKTINSLLEEEAKYLCNANRYERTESRKGYRSGHYPRSFDSKAGRLELKIPKLKHLKFETAIIERYKRRESSIEEALIEMYLAGVSVRRVEDITEALWGTKVSPGTVSNLNKQVYEKIEEWRNRKLEQEYPYVYLDGIVLKRSWGGEVKNVSILIAFGVNKDGFREILGATEGCKEDKEGWSQFLRHLKERGLSTPKLIISDKCHGLLASIEKYYPGSDWQRCVVHWYRNVLNAVPKNKQKIVSAMLKAIHSQEDIEAGREKSKLVINKLHEMKLKLASKRVNDGYCETLTYMNYPRTHWQKIRTNNSIERIMKEIRRRTNVVGSFPDGNSALMLVCARLRYIEGSKWGLIKYMNTDMFKKEVEEKQEGYNEE